MPNRSLESLCDPTALTVAPGPPTMVTTVPAPAEEPVVEVC